MVLRGRCVALPGEPAVHRVFAGHAARHPDRPALTCGVDQVWTYGELEARSNQFAHHLLGRGITRGSVVGVCLDRTPELMVAILGILKAGAAYLPLDPTYPQQRLRSMLDQVPRIGPVVVAAETRDLVTDVEHLDIGALSGRLDALPQRAPEINIAGSDLCYVVCTSGSTGSPKAVAVEHRGWYNLLSWLCAEYSLDRHASGLVVSPFGFDITQRALMTPLFAGAVLHLLPTRRFDPLLAQRLVETLSPDTLHCAPSAFYLLAEREPTTGIGPLAELGHVFLGGEPPSARRIAPWATAPDNRCSVVNVYGVAECTDISSAHLLVDYDAYCEGSVPAGKPVHNTEILVTDEDLTEVPDGETGEICVTGAGVGPGYVDAGPGYRDRFTTVERDGDVVRLHRTGDRGYVSPAGELMVVGRVDAQVKVRGMRVDLGDIEATIRRLSQVRDTAVLALPRGEEIELFAAVVSKDGPLVAAELRGQMARALPQGVVPQHIIEMDELPLNPNGKVDRAALAEHVRTPSRSRPTEQTDRERCS